MRVGRYTLAIIAELCRKMLIAGDTYRSEIMLFYGIVDDVTVYITKSGCKDAIEFNNIWNDNKQ